MDSESAFAKPQKLIDWAQGALDEAKAILDTVFANENVGWREKKDVLTGEVVVEVFLRKGIPARVEEHFTNALNNLRNSFDQMLFAAARAINRPLDDGHYPWSRDPTDLEKWKLRNGKTGEEKIPSELWDVIRAQEPYPRGDAYPGGDTLLRAIATFANRKHTVGIDVSAAVPGIVVPMPRPIPPAIAAALPESSISWPSPKWDPRTNCMEVVRWKGVRPRFNEKHRITFNISFDETAPPELQGVSAIDAVRKFADHAQTCLDGFKTRCAELSS